MSFWGSVRGGTDSGGDRSYGDYYEESDSGSSSSCSEIREDYQDRARRTYTLEESGSESSEEGKVSDDDKDNNDPTDLLLSPKCPPPTTNVFQHSRRITPQVPSPTVGGSACSSGEEPRQIPLRGVPFPKLHETEPTATDGSRPIPAASVEGLGLDSPMSPRLDPSLADLTRRRPLDPVFKATEGTFPKLVGGPRLSHPPPFQIFDPSQKKSDDSTRNTKSKPSQSRSGALSQDEASGGAGASTSTSTSTACISNSNERNHNDSVLEPTEEAIQTNPSMNNVPEPDDALSEGSEIQHAVSLDEAVYVWGDSDNATETTEELVEEVASEEDDGTSLADFGWDKADATLDEKQTTSHADELTAPPAMDKVAKQEKSAALDEQIDNKEETAATNTEQMGTEHSVFLKNTTVEKNENEVIMSLVEDSTNTTGKDNIQPNKTTKFVFLSEQKDVPFGLKMLQERTMRRRRDLLARMHDLDCQLANVSSHFAEERMDFSLAIDSLDRSVTQPLEAAAERLVMEREASSTRGQGVASLEHRLTKLDHQMTHQIYVTLGNHKRDELDGLHADLFHDIVPGINIENSKSNKIELGVVRRFEDIAGNVTKGFHNECAAQRTAIQQAQRKVDNATKTEDQRLDHILVAISELRAKTRQERAERREADARILDRIVGATVTMKRALLEAVGNTN